MVDAGRRNERRDAQDKSKSLDVSNDATLSAKRDALVEQRRAVVAGNGPAERQLREAHVGLAAQAAERGARAGATTNLDADKVAALRDRQVESLARERQADVRALGRAIASVEGLRRTQEDQRTRLDAAAARGVPADRVDEARATMEQNQARQTERAQELVAQLREAIADRALGNQLSAKADRAEMSAIATSPAADAERAKQYDVTLRQTANMEADRQRTSQAEIAHLQRELEAVRYQVDDQTLARLRDTVESEIGKALERPDQATARLSDEAIQRVANIILAERERSANRTDTAGREMAALQHAKGQLFEEMVNAIVAERVTADNRTRDAAGQARLVAGDAIRDARGQKLSDGMVVRPGRDSEKGVQLDEAWEVKAGREAARELDERFAKLSQNELDKLNDLATETALDRRFEEETGRRVAGDAAADREARARPLADAEIRERVAWEQKLTDDQMADVLVAAQRDYEELISRDAQREAGQPENLLERLRASVDLHSEQDLRTRFFENGREREIENDRRISTRVAVPNDVFDELEAARQATALRVDIESRKLLEIAEAIKKKLQDDRYW